MATHPPKVSLPYKVGNPWQEEQILAGILIESEQTLTIDLDRVDAEIRQQATAIWKRVVPKAHTLEVIGSGIRPEDVLEVGSDPDEFPSIIDRVIEKIGHLPQLPAPTDDPAVLLEAYAQWLRRYQDLSTGALAAWIDTFATDELEDHDRANGVSTDWWLHPITWKVGEEPARTTTVDGRKELEDFQRARGARQMVQRAQAQVDGEDFYEASEIVGDIVLDTRPKSTSDLVTVYADQCERIANLAFARYWTRLRKREGFNMEMARWAFTHGSDRLQIGLTDGYRMVPVYLKERIAAEVPGFYAHLERPDEHSRWQPRTAPTQPALELRRAVQARLDVQAPPGMDPAKAVVVWMKDPPSDMCEQQARYTYDEWGNEDGEKLDPFEAIIVEDWLGRYTLMAGLFTPEHSTPHYLHFEYILDPRAYDLPDLPRLSATDIPINIGDFAPAPGGSSAADDDIPF